MFQGRHIQDVVDLLKARDAKLYHACQLIDFQSYLSVGGIPTRKHLNSKGLPFTAFDTEQEDQDKGVWDKVFLNMSDFGTTFAMGGKGVPNPYGPILLQISPNALLEAADVAICLRSAGATDFSRENESLKSVDDVNRLFRNPDSGSKMKYSGELKREFGVQHARDPEISCSVKSGRLSIQHVSLIRVDAYGVSDTALVDQVKKHLPSHGHEVRVYERSYYNGRKQLLDELVELIICDPAMSLNKLAGRTASSDGLRAWADQLRDRDLNWSFSRYARYLRSGTLDPMLKS